MYSFECLLLLYSGKALQDNISAGGSKNENPWILGCWPQSRNRTTRMSNSRIIFSRMLGQLRNPRKFCPEKFSRCMVLYDFMVGGNRAH